MYKKYALNLLNKDEVDVKTDNGLEHGYVLGNIEILDSKTIIVPVQLELSGYLKVSYKDIL